MTFGEPCVMTGEQRRMFELILEASKNTTKEELIKVAASVREHNETTEVTASQMGVGGEDYAKY